ncbi:MAG: universal stress protein [Solirubrobacterales bacterium]
MFRKILVGYQKTEAGRDALELGRVMAKASGAELQVATAPSPQGDDLTRLVRDAAADLVVLGSTHRGPIGRVLPGATVSHLLGEALCAVAVAPPGFGRPADDEAEWRPLRGSGEDPGMRVVGVGYDGSRAAREALDTATELALANGAALRVVTVAQKFAHLPRADAGTQASNVPTEAEALREQLYKVVKALPAEARALPVFLRGIPAAKLIAAAGNGVDLMVLGSRRGGPLRRALHNSVSGAVMLEARCPVLVSPAGVRAPRPALA